VLGGDLNFTLSLKEVWGKHPKRDPLEDFFPTGFLLITWWTRSPQKSPRHGGKGRKGGDLVAKRLDRFLVEENMLANLWIIKLLVTIGGNSNHMPIY
jgi:hypothetical protein